MGVNGLIHEPASLVPGQMTLGTHRREDWINRRVVYSNVKVENTSTIMVKAVVFIYIDTV